MTQSNKSLTASQMTPPPPFPSDTYKPCPILSNEWNETLEIFKTNKITYLDTYSTTKTFDTLCCLLYEPIDNDKHIHTLGPIFLYPLDQPPPVIHPLPPLTPPTTNILTPLKLSPFSPNLLVLNENHLGIAKPCLPTTLNSSQLPVLVHPTMRRPDTPHPYVGILHQTQSAPVTDYCTICAWTSHSLVSCIQSLRGPIIRSYFHEVGHTRGICNNLQMDIIQPSASILCHLRAVRTQPWTMLQPVICAVIHRICRLST